MSTNVLNDPAWENAVKLCSSAGGKWLKLEKDCEEEIILRGLPFGIRFHWIDSKKAPCTAPDCQFCDDKILPNIKVIFNVVVLTSSGMEPRILETSRQLFEQIAENLQEHGADNIFKVKRVGTGMKTRYNVFFKAKLSEEQEKDLECIEMFDLKEIYEAKGFYSCL